MKLKISHTTTYSYDEPVRYGLQQVRLTPLTDHNQTVLNWAMSVSGGSEELQFQDEFNNTTMLVQAESGVSEISITVAGEVETHNSDGIYGKTYGVAPLWLFRQSTPRTTAGKGIRALAKHIKTPAGDLDELHALSAAILAKVPYGQSETNVKTTAEEALNAASGVCQDHAQIFISALRHAGIPARYISGYLRMDDRIDQDATHAWAEAHIDGLGWVSFDVSNGISADERYVRIAVGRDSREAAPMSGLRIGNSAENMSVSLQVQQ
ncbi:transglutaminase family protein [Lentibacter algarum]|uniref:transglutaminase family protein n=1 Tax=Lentibacter algarum TaxID=576131 RepID=UPI001C067BD1|nr:transglutaminase family protein [Lentibacter algarum]MBU2981942.1 transglutaminase family protein [Lentibacter algarum]